MGSGDTELGPSSPHICSPRHKEGVLGSPDPQMEHSEPLGWVQGRVAAPVRKKDLQTDSSAGQTLGISWIQTLPLTCFATLGKVLISLSLGFLICREPRLDGLSVSSDHSRQ